MTQPSVQSTDCFRCFLDTSAFSGLEILVDNSYTNLITYLTASSKLHYYYTVFQN